MPLTYAAAAASLGVDESAVRKAKRTGRITFPIEDLDVLKREWAERTDPSRAKGLATPGAVTNGHAPTGHAADILKARAEQMRTRADREALELQIRRGELVELQVVLDWVVRRERVLRASMLSIANELSGRVPAEARKLFAEAIRRKCDELARGEPAPKAAPRKRAGRPVGS